MLATFSSMLPSGLNFSSSKEEAKEQHAGNSMDKQAEAKEDQMGVKRKDTIGDETGAKKKREKGANETFIVVRPPPSMSNHPLNLQLQLVPPQVRDKSVSRRSVDYYGGAESTTDTASSPEGASLARTSSTRSNRSEVSMYSNVSSATSFTSLGSTASATTGRRMIIPLYNLSAHNVMTNTVLDAGTDAKVAKFHKRGLEVIGLALLDAMEIWGSVDPSSDVQRVRSKRQSLSPSDAEFRNTTPEPHTPTSSALSLSSAGDPYPQTPQSPVTPTMLNTAPPQSGTKKLFGKFFKKKEMAGGHSNSPSFSSVPPTPNSPRQSMSTLPVPSMPSHPRKSSASESVPPPVLQPLVLGIQPMLMSSHNPPIGRPTKYVWIVTKWLKGSSDSLLAGMMGKLNSERGQMREPGGEVEVQFEWTRGKNSHRRQSTHATHQGNTSRRASLLVPSSQTPSQTSLQRNEKRLSTAGAGRPSLDAPRSPSPRPTSLRESMNTSLASTSDDGHVSKPSKNSPTEDDGEESDPEDSETPWSCTAVVTPKSNARRGSSFSHSRNISAASEAAPTSLRVKVATLSPAPHHPKVVAQVKVPFPLPDIEIDHLQLRKRVVTASGIARPASKDSKQPEGLVLTAEEIKDILSTTAMWLIVREGFGGVGKVNRKGDGWRIRG